MKIGYARISTRDQNLDLQLDALKSAGCERIYQDVASGSKTARPALDELLGQLRAWDVLVIWKLDRMGRYLRHLVDLVGNLFASLAEFERELIRERTQAGLSAARSRGRVGGRPKGLSPQAQATAMAAETLYRERRMGVAGIAQKLHLSKSTLYSYLRHRGVEIGPYEKTGPLRQVKPESGIATPADRKAATIILTLRIHNNSKSVRGKKRTIEFVESFYLQAYKAKRRPNGDYELQVPYDTDQSLDDVVMQLLRDIANDAEDRQCFSESEARLEGTGRHW
jgi:DNA invertase Pin-like site-specific DNA recombinase